MNSEIDINTAKEEILKINELLDKGYLLIGGLAVNQYNPVRETADIDLVCESSIAKSLISKLYPAKDYDRKELNDDEYRPAWIITHKIKKNRIVFFGPKIKERQAYKSVDWDQLLNNSHPFHYRKKDCENIRVPAIESLAFLKILSFVDRVKTNRDKGHADLLDFIDLCNSSDFKINQFIDQIRASRTEAYIKNGILQASPNYDTGLWNKSLLMDLFTIINPHNKTDSSPSNNHNVFSDNYDKIYKTEDAVEFYEKIADKYDQRNTNLVQNTHRQVTSAIKLHRQKKGNIRVLDIGSGTGKLIAHQYWDSHNIEWHCIEPSQKMTEQFSETMKGSRIKVVQSKKSIFEVLHQPNDGHFDIVIISLVLSSLPSNPNFFEIAKFMAPDGKLLITDFYESCPYYDFHLPNEKIALYTRKIDLIDTLKSALASNLKLDSLDSIENRTGFENTFIMQFSKKEGAN